MEIKILENQEKKVVIITAILLFLMLVLFSYKSTMYSEGFYDKQFELNGVYEKYDRDFVQNQSGIVMSYLFEKGDGPENDLLKSNVFSEQDKAHLSDVKILFHKFDIFTYFVVGLFLLGFLIIHFVYKREYHTLLSKTILYSGIGTLGFLLILFLLSLNFDWFFTKFHEIFFSNDLWMMDSAKDLLVNLYPEQFWINAFSRIMKTTLLFGVAFAIVGYFSLKVRKKTTTSS